MKKHGRKRHTPPGFRHVGVDLEESIYDDLRAEQARIGAAMGTEITLAQTVRHLLQVALATKGKT